MHQVFGTKETATYYDREGAYLLPCRGPLVAVVQTPKGYFFLGGGLEPGESHTECIQRECLEEAGFAVRVGEKLCSAEAYGRHSELGYFHPIQTYYLGDLLERVTEPTEADHVLCWMELSRLQGKMFSQMQNWALEQLSVHLNRTGKKGGL